MKKKFGILDGIGYVGGLLALMSGISLVSIIQLIWNFLGFFTAWRKNDKNETTTIPRATDSRFRCFTIKLYHLKKDLKDFIKMSSVHGMRNLTGSVGQKFFWLITISGSTAACVLFAQDLFKNFNQNQVTIEIEESSLSAHEV